MSLPLWDVRGMGEGISLPISEPMLFPHYGLLRVSGLLGMLGRYWGTLELLGFLGIIGVIRVLGSVGL